MTVIALFLGKEGSGISNQCKSGRDDIRRPPEKVYRQNAEREGKKSKGKREECELK